MEATTRTHYANLFMEESDARYAAHLYIIKATDERVDWAYEVWDDGVAKLRYKGNHQRSIAAQLLCNLAKSDPDQRLLKDFAALLAVTKDKMFVTARHCLQASWKVGAAGTQQQQIVVDSLAQRFNKCITEKLHVDPLRHYARAEATV